MYLKLMILDCTWIVASNSTRSMLLKELTPTRLYRDMIKFMMWNWKSWELCSHCCSSFQSIILYGGAMRIILFNKTKFESSFRSNTFVRLLLINMATRLNVFNKYNDQLLLFFLQKLFNVLHCSSSFWIRSTFPWGKGLVASIQAIYPYTLLKELLSGM